jgi:hypothetical protein
LILARIEEINPRIEIKFEFKLGIIYWGGPDWGRMEDGWGMGRSYSSIPNLVFQLFHHHRMD